MRTYKRKITKVDKIIGNALRDGLYGFDKNKPYYVCIYKILDRERAIYKYFKTEEEAINFRDKISQEIKEGFYND